MRWPAFITPGPEGRLQRRLLLARAVILAERLWHALFWPLMLAGLMLLLVATGILPALPAFARLALWLAFLAALAWLLRDARHLRWPTAEEGLARLEERSNLPHQPLRTLTDDLAAPADDPAARALWQAHRQRLAERIRALRVGLPRSDAPRRDPHALRFALLLALIATLALNGGNVMDNLRASLRLPNLAIAGTPARLDAWIDPPAFIRTPPVMLATNGKLLHTGTSVRTVQGATLIIRHAGARAPRITLRALDPASGQPADILRQQQMQPVETGAWQARLKLMQPVELRLQGGGVDAAWRIMVLDDAPPLITLEKPPATTASGALELRWKATDDHGVRAARADIRLKNAPAGMLQYDPPKASLRVSRPGREVRGQDLLKLMAHPWAGLRASLTLVATDVAGQEGRSRAIDITLPTRPFHQPLARAIIEQRRALVLHPDARRDIAEVLAAFLAWPAGLLKAKESSAYLGLRHAMTALLNARSDDDVKQVVSLLWEIAVNIEDGDLADARRQLQAARKALQEALKNGASEEEIARRLAELKQALDRFLQTLAQRQMQQGQPRISRNGRVRAIRPQDLQRMMEQIERMARSGARDAAERLLSQLDNILQNLQTAPMQAMPPSPREKALGELQKLMRQQQKLMEETWREAQRQRNGQQTPREPQNGQQGRQATPGQRGAELQRQQQALAEALRQLMQKMQEQQEQQQQGPPGERSRQQQQEGQGGGGQQLGRSLQRAERAMKGAANRLGAGSPRTALPRQQQALRAMRQGAQRLARQIARQQGRQPGSVGMGSMRPRYDPLGRPLRGRYAEPGPDQRMVPEADAMQQARRILEYLRKRAEDATRPPLERNYIDRLLRGLY